jgi:hypothetical protein
MPHTQGSHKKHFRHVGENTSNISAIFEVLKAMI